MPSSHLQYPLEGCELNQTHLNCYIVFQSLGPCILPEKEKIILNKKAHFNLVANIVLLTLSLLLPCLIYINIIFSKKYQYVIKAKGYKNWLTTAELKWRLGAWSIQGLLLLAASPWDVIMPPWLAQQRNPAMSPHTKGKEQAPVTLKNISGEKTNKA